MQTTRNVTVIPATKDIKTGTPTSSNTRRKVAAYARVSTDSDEQLTSYEAQVDYYTKYIQANPEWSFAGMYTDEGISGVMTKNRDGFNSMVSDALSGKIDLIITKSVSRFARNTVDSLTTVRMLKEKGVEVYFEKENIYTLDGKGELLITIMSSLAQEESRSLSDNVTWGMRKRFSDGKVSMPYKQFLGYRKGSDDLPEIIPEEADIVRRIYKEYLHGMSINAIAKGLTADGIPTPSGKASWRYSTIKSILTNEKYKGSALLQKRYTVDYLTKTMKINEGEVPQYYVENSHPPIIFPTEWEAVQTEMANRRNTRSDSGRLHHCTSPFSGKIMCGDCGDIFGSKVWHSTDKYRRTIWQCNSKYKGNTRCTTTHLDEEIIVDAFLSVISEFLADRQKIVADLETALAIVDTSGIVAELDSIDSEMELIAGMARQCIMQNAVPADGERIDYGRRYEELSDKFESLELRRSKLQKELEAKQSEADGIRNFLAALPAADNLPLEFNEDLWRATVDHVTVIGDEKLVFTLKGGSEIEQIF